MDAADYAFYLAYGMTQDEEQLESLLDVKMYNSMYADMHESLEAGNSFILHQDASAA